MEDVIASPGCVRSLRSGAPSELAGSSRGQVSHLVVLRATGWCDTVARRPVRCGALIGPFLGVSQQRIVKRHSYEVWL